MTKLRRYCWRVGVALDLDDGDPCPECGRHGHRPNPDQSVCGNYVESDRWGAANYGLRDKRCFHPIGHDGPCHSEAATLAALEDKGTIVDFVDTWPVESQEK